jgi:hypothetical protein
MVAGINYIKLPRPMPVASGSAKPLHVTQMIPEKALNLCVNLPDVVQVVVNPPMQQLANANVSDRSGAAGWELVRSG